MAQGIGARIAGGILVVAGAGLFALALAAAAEKGITLSGPALAPVIVTGMWLGVAVWYLVRHFAKVEDKDEAKDESGADPARWRTPILLLAALIAYALVLKYTVVGYVLATSVFFVVAARLLSTRPLREVIVRDVTVAIGLSLAVYLSFTRLLGIVLPAGVLPL